MIIQLREGLFQALSFMAAVSILSLLAVSVAHSRLWLGSGPAWHCSHSGHPHRGHSASHSCRHSRHVLPVSVWLGPIAKQSWVVLLTINRRSCTIMEKAPIRAFSWLKAPTSAFTFKTLLRHYAERLLTLR